MFNKRMVRHDSHRKRTGQDHGFWPGQGRERHPVDQRAIYPSIVFLSGGLGSYNLEKRVPMINNWLDDTLGPVKFEE
jgi:hypothetical protein